MDRSREYEAVESKETPEFPLKEWRDKFESNALTSADLMQYFQSASPFFFSIGNPTHSVDLDRCPFNELGAKSAIIDALEQFIFGDNPETVIGEIKAEQKWSACNRVIKTRQRLYSCLECGVSPMHVLCVKCFKQSEHRFHNYRIETSSSGDAICDCGVSEAWKRNSHCDEHKGGVENLQSTVITERMRERCYIVYDAVLTYCMRSLNIESMARLHGQEGDITEDDTFCTVLYNRESYRSSFNIINTADTEQQAAVSFVTRNRLGGRAVVKCASFQECMKLKEEIEKNTRCTMKRPIKLPWEVSAQKRAAENVSYVGQKVRLVSIKSFDARKVYPEPLNMEVTLFRRVSKAAPNSSAVAKCTSAQCIESKEQMFEVRTMHSMKVAVLRKNVVAYQQFSLHLLGWFQDFVSRSPVFRAIFAEMITQTPGNSYTLREILLNDCKLWKTARTAWHRLLIAGMLMEHENKKTLAVMFTKQYTQLMRDYINGEYERSDSITALSTFLFQVPSIAQHLFAHETVFFKLMQIFYSESIEMHVKNKIIQFNWNMKTLLVRAAYVLSDLKAILSFKPDVWTDELRQNFLDGVQILIRLLKEMQGMDPVIRQTCHHTKFEFDWDSAFNLHIKLAPITSLVLDWCSSDRLVFFETYRMVLSNLNETEYIVSQSSIEMRELAGHIALCQMYDVSTKQVSIHLPLSRFFAGLYLLFEKYELTFDTFPMPIIKPIPGQIIEPILCTMTMVAQVHAGLWPHNENSLVSRLNFYRRADMLDRDVVVLQIGASLIESNKFLIHLLNKFNLINWAAADYETTSLTQPEEDGLRRIINMVDEMLELIIVIVGERHVQGIGMVNEKQKVQKEIIQALCIKPHSHSELLRKLPDVQNVNFINDMIDSVASFKKPTQFDKIGVYELKPQHYDDYNMYFYHYTKEGKSKSEEEQRKRRIAKDQLVCCPPPKLPQLTPLFSKLTNLLQCDVMLLLMQTILKRANDPEARSFSDSHLQKVLHLIGYAVQEQASGAYPFFTFYDRAARWDLLPLMEELVSSARVEAHRDLILWTVRKYKELLPKNHDEHAMESEDVSEAMHGESSSATCDCGCVSVCKEMADVKIAEEGDCGESVTE